ncbi:MAG: hypothetical protein V4686_00140 [Patescibacteria group bacterium]
MKKMDIYCLLFALGIIISGLFAFRAGAATAKRNQEVTVLVSENGSTRMEISHECKQKARKWCEYQISQNNPESENFKSAIQSIAENNICWNIDSPYGLHYSNVVVFARAWDKK